MNSITLKLGQIIIMENDEGTRRAEISFSKHLDKFIIWFNGELLHSSNTFPPMQKRLNVLIEKWGLKEINE